MNTLTLYEEFRLIERNEDEINLVWKGAQLLLFFLAFVFGSFCTFCFHVLMYLFDEKCVLFPKLLSIKEFHHSIIYEYVPDKQSDLPVDFVSTQWVEKSQCYLPTYVPLVSGICGLVWTTLFLMCSSGSRTLTGLQRPWRVLPTIFVFSVAMGSLCIYTSSVTTEGLQQLCAKLAQITNSPSCSYTVNLATMAYERRIRGVFQAIRLTITSAWLHALCWVCAAILALLRILLVVDFQLVRVRADLQGNIERMLERHEEHVRTVSPEFLNRDDATNTRPLTATESNNSVAIQFVNQTFSSGERSEELLFKQTEEPATSATGLLPEERLKIQRMEKYKILSDNSKSLLHGIMDRIKLSRPSTEKGVEIKKQKAETILTSNSKKQMTKISHVDSNLILRTRSHHGEVHNIGGAPRDTKLKLAPKHKKSLVKVKISSTQASYPKKSNLKNKDVQTDAEREKRMASQKVQIGSRTDIFFDNSIITLKPPSDTDMKESEAESKKNETEKKREPHVKIDTEGNSESGASTSQNSESGASTSRSRQTRERSTHSRSTSDKETATPPKEKQD